MADIKLFKKGAVFDFELKDGDFIIEEGFDTAILMSFYGETRADESQVEQPQFREGWWGNELNDIEGYEYGSQLWLLRSSRNVQTTANRAVTFTEEGFKWFKQDSFLKSVEVTAENTVTDLKINIKLIRNNNEIDDVSFFLWENTNLDVN